MNILISGNPSYGLAASLKNYYPDATFISRTNGYDLTSREGIVKLEELITQFDVFINCSALWKFNQTIVLDAVYKNCILKKHNMQIICIGSTTDRVKKAMSWLYNAEKKALRDYCNSLSMLGVWQGGPRVSLISFGSLSNVQYKHPERKCLEISRAASYVKWLIEQPADININEISIEPLQQSNV